MDFSPRPNSLVSNGVFNLPVAKNPAEDSDSAVPSVGAISLDSSPGNFPVLRDGSPSPNANSVFNSTLATIDSIDSDLRTLSSEDETVKKLSFDLDPLYKSSLEDEEQDTAIEAVSLQDRIQLISDLICQPFIDGDIWYVVSAVFYNKFINAEPGLDLAFGNFDIVDPVTKRLRSDAQTQLVPVQAWKHFVNWYPSTNHFALPRKVTTENGMLTIEMFPYELIVKPYSLLSSFPQQELFTLSKNDPLTELSEQVTKKFNIAGGESAVRFWLVNDDSEFLPRIYNTEISSIFFTKLNKTKLEISDTHIYESSLKTDSVVIVEIKSGNRDDIPWPSEKASPLKSIPPPLPAREPRALLYKREERSSTAGKMGLTNLGNTCYMNSALQCLSHVPELAKYFLCQIWSKDIYVFPRVGRPVILSIELNQSATGQQLKQYICEKLNLDIDAIHFAEIFNGMFYKNLSNIDSVTEISTSDNEIIGCYELDFKVEDFDSENDLIVPVYFEMESSDTHFKAISIPFYIYLTTKEAEDANIIQQKILRKAAQFNDTSEAVIKDLDLNNLPFTVSYHTVHNADVPVTEWRIFRRSLKPLVVPTVEIAEEQSSSNVSMATPESNSSPANQDSALETVKDTQDTELLDTNANVLKTELEKLNEDSTNPFHESSNNQFGSATPDIDELPDTFTPDIAVSDSSSDINDHINTENLLERITSPKDSELPDDSSRPISPAVFDLSGDEKAFENLGTIFDDDDDNNSSHLSLMDPAPAYSNYNQQRTGALVDNRDVLVCTWNPQAFVAVFGQEYVNATIATVSDPELENHRAERQRKKEQGIPLSDCLDQFSKTEVLGEDDLWHCSRCKDFRRASKTIELWKIPDIFTIHLKRFSSYHGMGDKLDDLVNFPILGLDMTDRIQKTRYGNKIEETIEEGDQVYDLFAVDNHYGGLGGGHYTAFAKNFVDNEWYYFDDSRVRKADPEDSVTSAAYLLFYRRRSTEPLGGEDLNKILKYIEEHRELDSAENTSSATEEPATKTESFQGTGRLLGTSTTPNQVSMPWNTTTKLNIDSSGSESDDEDFEDDDEEDEDDDDDVKDEAYSPASESNFSNASD